MVWAAEILIVGPRQRRDRRRSGRWRGWSLARLSAGLQAFTSGRQNFFRARRLIEIGGRRWIPRRRGRRRRRRRNWCGCRLGPRLKPRLGLGLRRRLRLMPGRSNGRLGDMRRGRRHRYRSRRRRRDRRSPLQRPDHLLEGQSLHAQEICSSTGPIAHDGREHDRAIDLAAPPLPRSRRRRFENAPQVGRYGRGLIAVGLQAVVGPSQILGHFGRELSEIDVARFQDDCGFGVFRQRQQEMFEADLAVRLRSCIVSRARQRRRKIGRHRNSAEIVDDHGRHSAFPLTAAPARKPPETPNRRRQGLTERISAESPMWDMTL